MLTMLFEPGRIGTLQLPNRLIRSATAERMADGDGRPTPPLVALYRDLARGGVGLIISGHMYVHPWGKAHEEMTGIYADHLIPGLAELVAAVHQEGGLIAAQINHGGMQANAVTVSQPSAPSATDAPFLSRPAQELPALEIDRLVKAYATAAGRAQEAGFDAVQLHGAHGYLISQFLSPFVNRRTDSWGGDLQARTRFLRAVCAGVRDQVGADYPVFIKLGMQDAVAEGLSAQDGAEIAAELEGMGLDAIEISGGIGGATSLNIPTGIRSPAHEAVFRPWARAARSTSSLPIALVGGLRTRHVMEDVLQTGDADFISLCRPLICEPDLPMRLRDGIQERSACISASRCWPSNCGEGIACRCPVDRV